MEKKVNFEMEELIPDWLDNYPEKKFTVFKACFLSTKKNSHNLDISEKVLRENAGSILGNFLVAKLEYSDATTHLPDEIIYGYFPREQEIEFEEVIDGDNKVVKAWAYCVISKQYGQEFNEIFSNQNLRNTSVEMTVELPEGQDEGEVYSFDIFGLTCLGMTVNGSCPDAQMSMIRFSEDEATTFFNKVHKNMTMLEQFVQKRKENMAESKKYKIDKSKEAMSDKAWGEVDKAAMRDKIMEASNKATLVKSVYALVEDGWQDAPSEHLKYPIMELKGDTFVYNKNGLSSALGYAKKENETAVVNKINKIYKNLGLDNPDSGKEEDAKMAKEIEFAAVDIGDMWGKVWSAIRSHDTWRYCIEGIYEEDNKKFAVLKNEDGILYRLDFSLTEEGMTTADELIEIQKEFIETDKVVRFAEPENVEDYRKFVDDEDDDDTDKDNDDDEEEETKKMSADEMETEMSRLKKDIEDRDNIIMEKDAELEDLRAFKKSVEDKEKAMSVEAILEEVKDFLSADQIKQFREEGISCQMSELDGWTNKVKAVSFEATKGKSTSKSTRTDIWSFGAVVETHKEKGLWD